MSRFIRYVGHRYRLAQEPAADEPAAEKPDEPTEQQGPCTNQVPEDNGFVKAAKAALAAAQVEGTPIQLCREADGVDVKLDVGSRWGGVEAVLTCDFNAQGKLQELVLNMCHLDFVAHTGRFGGGKTINMLLATLNVLQSTEFNPQKAGNVVQDKKKIEYIEFVTYYVAELLMGAVDLPYENRKAFAEALQKLENYPKERRDTMVEGALKWMNDQDWKDHIEPLIQSQGRQYAATQELINRAVAQLIPSHEKYTGSAQVLKYLDNGEILVAIEVPKPIDSFMFVFQHAAGQKKLQLVTAGLGLCGATFTTGADANRAGQLVSAMINLAILNGRTAQPELSQPPEVVVKQLTSKEWADASASGLVIWENTIGGRRLVWKGDKNAPCYTKEEWQDRDNLPTLKNALDKARSEDAGVFYVSAEGVVDQADYRGTVTKKNVFQVDPTTGRACPINKRR